MARPTVCIPVPGMHGLVVNPHNGKLRNIANRNYLTHLFDDQGHPYIKYQGFEVYVDRIVYAARHGSAKYLNDDYGHLVHLDRDPSEVGINNLELRPMWDDFEYYKNLMEQPPVPRARQVLKRT